MTKRSAVLLVLVFMPVAWAPVYADCDQMKVDVGGGILAGGYFGEPSHDWSIGMGGSLFIQSPVYCHLEGRLRASMLWNDGNRSVSDGNDEPDLGAEAGDQVKSFRRSSYELSLLWKAEDRPDAEFIVPYLGTGISTYERRVEFLSTGSAEPANEAPYVRTESGWDWGFHGIAGLRFYRTSGLFVALEGTCHAIDTPKEWTGAYDISLLLGVELNR
jgi:hypothetical protein